MKFGLPTATIEKIRAVLARFPHVERAVLYGSRAKGNFKPGSDIDLTLFGETLTSSQLGQIAGALDDLLLPYTIDLSIYADLNHAKLREHIDRVGVMFYERGSAGQHPGAAVKKGWPIKTLGDVLEKTETVNPVKRPDDLIDYIDVSSVSSADLRITTTQRIQGKDAPSRARKLVSVNDVIFATIRPTLRRIAIVPEQLDGQVCSTGFFVLRIKPEVDFRFAFYFLQTEDFMTAMEMLQKGASYPAVTDGDVRSQKIPVPPLAEQQRIVGLLDEAFEGLATAKANAEKNLQNARALFESHLNDVFSKRGEGWVEKRLESCCEQIFAGGDVPKDRLSEERTPQFSVPIYSNGEKNDGLYGFTDVARVTKPSITVSARGTLGFTAIRTEPFLPVVRLIVLVPDERQITLSFLYYAVVGMDFGNTGTSIPQLTVPNFRESKLHVPGLSEQKVVVEELDALSTETQRLAAIYSRKLAALEALRKSLLHQAFSGGL